jgi:small conductance mechanosensitive channel
MRNLVFGIGLAVVIVAALGVVGVPNASLLAVLGAAGLGIGLALKDSLANLASGVLLVLFRPFSAGDYVEIAGQGGNVSSIELMFTRLITPDNREVLVPNGEITTNPIINFTARDRRRIDLVVGVAYESEADEAIQVIRDVLAAESRVLDDPEPQMMLLNLGESSVDIAVRPWVKTPDFWSVRSDLLRAIKRALTDAGIEIPFPQRTVRVVGAAPREALAHGGATATD